MLFASVLKLKTNLKEQWRPGKKLKIWFLSFKQLAYVSFPLRSFGPNLKWRFIDPLCTSIYWEVRFSGSFAVELFTWLGKKLSLRYFLPPAIQRGVYKGIVTVLCFRTKHSFLNYFYSTQKPANWLVKSSRMDKFEKDGNGLQSWFLKTCQPKSFSKFSLVVCNFDMILEMKQLLCHSQLISQV